MRNTFRLRLQLLSVFVVLIASLLLVRLYVVQVVRGEYYSDRADRQYVRPSSNLYDRGNIFFEDKEKRLISAATIKSGFLVAINPSKIEDIKAVYKKLSTFIKIDEKTFTRRAEKKSDPYEEVAHHVSSDVAKKIEEQDIKGVRVYKERWRYYPGGSLASQTVGFVGFRGSEYAGRYGLEKYYEETLVREENSLYVNFFAEIFANIQIFKNDTKRLGDVVVTIEPSVQLFLEQKLKEITKKWNGKETVGIIINPKNGEIYALGVYPSFNLNAYSKVKNVSIYLNPLIESVYEMGSIVKPLTMAAGLDSGAVTANSTYYDAGHIKLDGYTISNYDGRGRGTVPMQQILSQSLNTGAAFVEREMGNESFSKYFSAYGIGDKTGIDLPGEVEGLVRNLKGSHDIEYATASFGQGIAITPIQTVRALSVLANGGSLITPHVGKEIKYKSGFSKSISFPEGKRVLKQETSEEISRMLVRVVDEALRGGTVALPRYSIAAKTGTAQIADPSSGGYYDDRYLHTFFGYFPAYDAQYLIFFLTLEPKGVRYASETLTAPFMDTVKFLINYYEVPPDR